MVDCLAGERGQVPQSLLMGVKRNAYYCSVRERTPNVTFFYSHLGHKISVQDKLYKISGPLIRPVKLTKADVAVKCTSRLTF